MTDFHTPAYVSRSLSRVENAPSQLALSTALVAAFIAVSSIADVVQRGERAPIDYATPLSTRVPRGAAHHLCDRLTTDPACSDYEGF